MPTLRAAGCGGAVHCPAERQAHGRDDYEKAMCAANDNSEPDRKADAGEGQSTADEDE
jgi:hypothetical protein